jgi:integrase/recombinase XerD
MLLEEVATNLRDKLLIHLLFHLGCRISEALSLALEDVDFERGTVTIKHLKASVKLSCTQCGQRIGRSHAFCPKCGSRITKAQAEQLERRRQRMLPLDADTLDMLKEYGKRGGPVVRGDKRV